MRVYVSGPFASAAMFPVYALAGLCLRAYLPELQSNNTPESLPENAPAHLGCALGPVHEYHRHLLLCIISDMVLRIQ